MTGRQVFAEAYVAACCYIVAEEGSSRIQAKTGSGPILTLVIFLLILTFGLGQMRVIRKNGLF